MLAALLLLAVDLIMLPSGPRSTYPFSSGVQPGARAFARQILASIDNKIAKANEIRVGMMTIGCDGNPQINPLDGSTCNGTLAAGVGTQVLFNPATRTVLGTIKRPAAGIVSKVTVHGCPDLRLKRRFIDNLGNMYGPTGLWLSGGNPPAQLETDYVHRKTKGFTGFEDTKHYFLRDRLYLEKTYGVPASLLFTGDAQGTVWPSINDLVTTEIKLNGFFNIESIWTQYFNEADGIGLNDVTMGGSFGLNRYFVAVSIDSIGAVDTFMWWIVEGSADLLNVIASGTGVPITGSPQALAEGAAVLFGAPTGHALYDSWQWSSLPDNNIVRQGVATRGNIATATPCSSPVNSGLLVTAECSCSFPALTNFDGPSGYRDLDSVLALLPEATAIGSHALVVRNADTLELLYRKSLTYDADALAWGDPPQKFSFSTNAEGLFFMHCYTTPVLTSPPTPYPGAEFGSPNPRKVAVISVDPTTFEPTITEIITLEDNAHTTGSTFVVATAP